MSTEKNEFKGDFDADVPEHLQDNVLTRIIEVAHEFFEDSEIEIIDVQHFDEMNIEFSGTIVLEGKRHCFHVRDGDRNGTEVISWNDEADAGIDLCENSEVVSDDPNTCPEL